MPQWDGKSKGNRLGYSIFIFLLKKGGLKAAYFLLKVVSHYYVYFMPEVTRPLNDLYRNKLKYAPSQAKKLIKKNITIFGQTLIDKIAVLAQIPTQFLVSHSGEEHLDSLAKEGKGGILISAHLGNWELAGHLLKRYNTIINIVMYDGEATGIKELMRKKTGPKSFQIIYIREDMSHIYEMSAALARNELICLHADRFVKGNRTAERMFLGETASFPYGPFILSSKLKAPVCFVFAFKSSNYQYDFFCYPPKVYEGRGLSGADDMLQDYISILENKVKEHPEQWFNYYDFWEKKELKTESV